MPHLRSRYAEPLLKKFLAHRSIVGVLGQRQTGKTTLAAALSQAYVTLDLSEIQDQVNQNPLGFLAGRQLPFTIDECQLVPDLFPALKEWVRMHPKKGQFILTGSVRFTSRKAIRESLTGRIINLELLPMSIAESNSEPLPRKLVEWIGLRTFHDVPVISKQLIEKGKQRFQQFLEAGGLPGVCFFREKHVRAARLETHLETLLERDIRLLVNTTATYRQLRMLARWVALNQGMPLNFSDIARTVGVSPPSVKKLISAFESMFLVRTLSVENLPSSVAFFEDQGLATHLIADQREPQLDLVRGLHANLVPQFLYRPELAARFSQYRTRGGACIQWMVQTEAGSIGVVPVAGPEASLSALASSRSFLAHYPEAKVIIAHQGYECKKISDRILSIPYPLLLSDL